MSRAHFASIAGPDRLRLISAGQITGFVLVVLLALLEIHRMQHLSLRAASDAEHDSVAIAYLHAWLKTEPDNADLRLLLVRKLLHSGNTAAATQALAPLIGKAPFIRQPEVRRLWQDLLWRHLWSLAPASPDFAAAAASYRHLLAALPAQKLSSGERWQDAHQAEALRDPALALSIMQAGPEREPAVLLYDIHLSQTLGQRRRSAADWFVLQDQSRSIAQARQAYRHGLDDLQACGETTDVAGYAYRHLHRLQKDPQSLVRLAELAQATGDLDLAVQVIAAALRQKLLPATPPP